MSASIDHVGKQYHKLTVLKNIGITNGRTTWLCRCDCGKEVEVIGRSLTNGNTKSCGCYRKEVVSKLRSNDLNGRTFGRLKIICKSGSTARGILWVCRCDCGERREILSASLTNGNTKSCGCARNESNVARSKTHGLTCSPEYVVWSALKSRCLNPNNLDYPSYGGRGITICEQWLSFEAFYIDMGPRPDKGYSVERCDNNGNYDPSNCHWVTVKEQSRNKRNTRYVEYEGQSISMAEVAEKADVNYDNLKYLLNKGFTASKAITQLKSSLNLGDS